MAKTASHKDARKMPGISLCLSVKFIIAIVGVYSVQPHRNFYATVLSGFDSSDSTETTCFIVT